MARTGGFDTARRASRTTRMAVSAALLGLALALAATCVSRIDAAHVGLRVKLAGSSRGVDDIPIVTGWVLKNPLTEQIVTFPTSVQNVVWAKGAREGSEGDESITFSSREGVNVNADIGFSFHIEPSKAPHLYARFRKQNLLDLADGYVRNAVRQAFNVVASEMAVQDIYGAGKGTLVGSVVERLEGELGPDGFVIDQLTWNGALRLPENVAGAINRGMEATQLAVAAENRVRQVEAEAEQAVTQAEGAAEAARARARGDADARLVTAQAEAKANLMLRYSTTTTVLRYRAIERWDGELPLMHDGTSLPMLGFEGGKLGRGDEPSEAKLRELLEADGSAPHRHP